MNKDFHYEGTYCAALDAGIASADAQYIANAAQMVDNCTKPHLEHMGQYMPNSILTMESNGEFAADAMSDFEKPDGVRLKEIRRTWMPFHFLPGNVSFTMEYKGRPDYKSYHFSLPRDTDDFRCMCLHSSELVKQMIDDTQQRYLALTNADEPLNSPNWKRMRSLVGIRMHVLADTWAHEYFTGTPSYWINNATAFKKLDGAPLVINETGTGASSAAHSFQYMGHGRAGHYPDYGFLSYHYHAQWTNDTDTIIKNNPYNFKCAYAQMVDALRYIQSPGVPGGYTLKTDVQIMSDFEALPNAAEIARVVESDKTDQTRKWRENLAAALIEYDADKVDLSAFQVGAALQLLLVKRYLESQDICYL